MENWTTIQKVVDARLCMGCGFCASLCPTGAINMRMTPVGTYEPKISDDMCVQCADCLTVCPGHEVNFDSLERVLCGEELFSNPILGRYESIFSGHSLNEDLRLEASSGGVITSLLIHALKSGRVNGAIVTNTNKDKPLEPMPQVVTTVEDLLRARGSKYCPVPVGVCLDDVMTSSGKFAFVGLPCHIQALRKAQNQFRELRERIVMTIGLFCSRVPTIEGTRFLLELNKVDVAEISTLNYRGSGWPGLTRFRKKDNTNIVLGPFPQVWAEFFGYDIFTQRRCLFCSDPLASLADVSCGDPWLPEFLDDDKGSSVVIARTKTGLDLLREAEINKAVILTSLPPDRVIASQASGVRRKRTNLKATFWFAKNFLGQDLPSYVDTRLSSLYPSRIAYLFAWLPFLSQFIGRNKSRSLIWWKLPYLFRDLYRRLYLRLLRY